MALFLKFVGQKFWPEITSNFKGYWYRVAVNEARGMIRSRNRLKEDDVFQDLEVPVPAPGAVDDGEREKLWNVIARLKPDVAPFCFFTTSTDTAMRIPRTCAASREARLP